MSAWGGIAGVQFRLAAVWTEAKQRGASLPQMSRWLSSSPAKLVISHQTTYAMPLCSWNMMLDL